MYSAWWLRMYLFLAISCGYWVTFNNGKWTRAGRWPHTPHRIEFLNLWSFTSSPHMSSHCVAHAEWTWLSSLLVLVLNNVFLLQLRNVKTDGCDSGKGLQRKNAWRRRKDEMKVQVRFQKEDLGTYFRTCLSLLHTLGRGGRHNIGHISCRWIYWKVVFYCMGNNGKLLRDYEWICCFKYTDILILSFVCQLGYTFKMSVLWDLQNQILKLKN